MNLWYIFSDIIFWYCIIHIVILYQKKLYSRITFYYLIISEIEQLKTLYIIEINSHEKTNSELQEMKSALQLEQLSRTTVEDHVIHCEEEIKMQYSQIRHLNEEILFREERAWRKGKEGKENRSTP